MIWNPVVAGIDGSSESAVAATVAMKLAEVAGTECYLVHASSPASAMPAPIAPRMELLADLNKELVNHLRRSMRNALLKHLSPDLIESTEVEVRLGDSTWALSDAIRAHQASLLVLGGKHHSTIRRWLGGSTAHHAVRMIDVPMLVTASDSRPFTRVLIGIDLSHAAEHTLGVGQQIAKLYNARLRVLHIIEPFPLLANLSLGLDETAYCQASEDVFYRVVNDALGTTYAERDVRRGVPSSVLRKECRAWNANLLVVGTHGRGWIERAMIGSTTNKLLNDLPTSLLVVPCGDPPRRGARS